MRLTPRELLQLYELLDRYCLYHMTKYTPVALVDARAHIRRIVSRQSAIDKSVDPSHY